MHANNKNTNKNTLDINLHHNHKVDKIDGVIGLPTKFWLEIKERSADNTLPIAIVIFWSQFSLSYLSVLVITKGDVSFITAAFNPTLISTYAFVSSVLVIAFVASLAIKYVNKQRAEKKELNEINETAANATKIEITPDLGNKEEEISIILPISENQETILKKQMEENRNKVVLLIAPSLVVTTFLVIGALYKSGFSFANVSDWIEVAVIAITVATAIVGACILVNKLQKNGVTKVDDTLSTVKKFSNADILCPWEDVKTILVMERYAIDQKEDDLTSKLMKLFDKHLAEFTNKTVDSLDGRLAEAIRLLDKKLLEPASAEIKGTLDHLKGIREDLKSVLDILIPEIDKLSQILGNARQLVGKMNSLDIEGAFSKLQNTIEAFEDTTKLIKDKVERFQISSYIGNFSGNAQPQNNQEESSANEFFATLKKYKEKLEKAEEKLAKAKEELKEVNNELQGLKNKHTQPSETDSGLGSEISSSTAQYQAKRNEEILLEIENKQLKSEARTRELKEENAKMKKDNSQKEEASKRQEKLNGKLGDFVRSLLESIKPKGKNSNNEEVTTTLSSCDNQVKIFRKDGPPIICNVGEGNLQFKPNSILIEQHSNISQKGVVSCVPLN